MKFSSRSIFSLLTLIVIALCVVFGIRQSRVNAVQTSIVPGSLEALAQTIANEGGSTVEVPMPMYHYGPARGINQVLADYSVVVGHPISSSSQVWDSENQIIGSWYKFVVTETLSSKPFPTCSTCLVAPDPPAAMTAGTGELLVPKYGGVVNVNGVTITSNDPNFPPYQASQNYLLFLQIDSNKKVGMLTGGPIAAFLINANGTLSPSSSLSSALADDIAQTYGNSLSALRSGLSGTPTPTPAPSPCSVASQVIAACYNNGGDWNFETCTCN